MIPTKDILDQQVDDLRDRMKLLQQDRRANVDLLESNKASNSEEIRSLREDNKKLRMKLTNLQKRLTNGRGDQHELAAFQKESLRVRTEFDTLKVVTSKHRKEINKLRGEAKMFELESKAQNGEYGPMGKQIRMLEKKLDRAMIKYNEAQSIKGTYEHIVKRLKEERLSFNNQLTALERTLKAKQRDYDELQLLSNDANHAKESAQHDLQQARNAYEDKKSKRASEIRERQQVVRIRKQMLEKQEKRDTNKREMMEQQAEKARRESQATTDTKQYSMIYDKEKEEEQQEKLKIYEFTLRKIKDAMGINGLDEVIDKLESQKTSESNLKTLTTQNRMRINYLKKEREKLRTKAEEMKFHGEKTMVRRKNIEDTEELLVESTCQLDRAKSKFEGISSLLMSAKSGIRHLQEKVKSVGIDAGNKEDPQKENESTILWSVGNLLVEIAARIQEDEMNHLHDIDGEDVGDDGDDVETSMEFEAKLNIARPFNQRIKLPSAKDNLFENDSNSEVYEIEDDELSRDRLKKNSNQLIRAELRQRQKALMS